MMSFTVDELVWAATRERNEDARRVRPHMDARPADKAQPPHMETETAYYLDIRQGTRGTLGA